MLSFGSAIDALNRLKREKVIGEYTVLGAVAAAAYVEPVFTEDLDIIVEVDSDNEYVELFRRVAEHAESQSMQTGWRGCIWSWPGCRCKSSPTLYRLSSAMH